MVLSCMSSIRKETLALLGSHFLSSWSDRMWSFAVPMYLIRFTPQSLQLIAIYGLIESLVSMLFAPAVGHLVDKNPRLKVVRISLVLQNLVVVLCALVVLVLLYLPNLPPSLFKFSCFLIVMLGAFGSLFSLARKFAIERDWVVVMSRGDQEALAGLNSKLRTIDLACNVLAPLAAGQVMTFISLQWSAISLCIWNVVSLAPEYVLLYFTHRMVSELHIKDMTGYNEAGTRLINRAPEAKPTVNVSYIRKLIRDRLEIFQKGCSSYFRHRYYLAGASLAFLYLTVLGFDAITSAYLYSQNLSESSVSICYAAGSLMGIVGALLHPYMQKLMRLQRVGLISTVYQFSFVILCVISIWLPGSVSQLCPWCQPSVSLGSLRQAAELIPSTIVSTSLDVTGSPLTPVLTTVIPSVEWSVLNNNSLPQLQDNYSHGLHPNLTATIAENMTTTGLDANTTLTGIGSSGSSSQAKYTHVSIIVFLVGLIASRTGLWLTDLTVTQLLQITVHEHERGIVSGIQTTFNSIFDSAHYVLVMFLYRPQQFGILVLISASAVAISASLYFAYYISDSNQVGGFHKKASFYREVSKACDTA